jgi:hypothetical protein
VSAPVPAAPAEMDRITREIHTLEAHAIQRATSAIEFKVEIGKRLERAKGLLPHGAFVAWAEREFGWTARHVQRHLVLARNTTRVSHLPPEASLRAALAAIAEADRAAAPEENGDASSPHYVLALVLPGGEEIDLPLRPILAEDLMGRELTTATLRVLQLGREDRAR